MASERDECLAAGMNDFLTKPFKPHELFAVVEQWAARAAERRSRANVKVDQSEGD